MRIYWARHCAKYIKYSISLNLYKFPQQTYPWGSFQYYLTDKTQAQKEARTWIQVCMILRNPCFDHCMIVSPKEWNNAIPTLNQPYGSLKEWLRGDKTAIGINSSISQTCKIQVETQKQYLKGSLNHRLRLNSISGGVWKAATIDRMA